MQKGREVSLSDPDPSPPKQVLYRAAPTAVTSSPRRGWRVFSSCAARSGYGARRLDFSGKPTAEIVIVTAARSIIGEASVSASKVSERRSRWPLVRRASHLLPWARAAGCRCGWRGAAARGRDVAGLGVLQVCHACQARGGKCGWHPHEDVVFEPRKAKYTRTHEMHAYLREPCWPSTPWSSTTKRTWVSTAGSPRLGPANSLVVSNDGRAYPPAAQLIQPRRCLGCPRNSHGDGFTWTSVHAHVTWLVLVNVQSESIDNLGDLT